MRGNWTNDIFAGGKQMGLLGKELKQGTLLSNLRALGLEGSLTSDPDIRYRWGGSWLGR